MAAVFVHVTAVVCPAYARSLGSDEWSGSLLEGVGRDSGTSVVYQQHAGVWQLTGDLEAIIKAHGLLKAVSLTNGQEQQNLDNAILDEKDGSLVMRVEPVKCSDEIKVEEQKIDTVQEEGVSTDPAVYGDDVGIDLQNIKQENQNFLENIEQNADFEMNIERPKEEDPIQFMQEQEAVSDKSFTGTETDTASNESDKDNEVPARGDRGVLINCKECSRTFVSHSNLYRHIHNTHNQFRVKCTQCNKTFSSQETMERHVKIYHENLQCKSCIVIFNTNEELNNHKCPGEKVGKYQCDLCNKSYFAANNLKKHLRVVHEGHIFPCEECDKQYRSKDSLYDHYRFFHRLLKCIRCQEILETDEEYELHLKNHASESYCRDKKKPALNHPCNQCPLVFSNKLERKEHLLKVHNVEVQVCSQCSNEFDDRQKLQLHMRTDHNAPPLTCYCGRVFTSRKMLANHQIKEHKQKALINSYECEFCGKGFLYDSNMTRHIRRDHQQCIRFVCDECGKEFKNDTALKEHRDAQHGEVRIKCKFCEQTFKTKKQLSNHMSSKHHDRKSFKCDNCGKAFIHLTRLENHLRKVHGIIHRTPAPPTVSQLKQDCSSSSSLHMDSKEMIEAAAMLPPLDPDHPIGDLDLATPFGMLGDYEDSNDCLVPNLTAVSRMLSPNMSAGSVSNDQGFPTTDSLTNDNLGMQPPSELTPLQPVSSNDLKALHTTSSPTLPMLQSSDLTPLQNSSDLTLLQPLISTGLTPLQPVSSSDLDVMSSLAPMLPTSNQLEPISTFTSLEPMKSKDAGLLYSSGIKSEPEHFTMSSAPTQFQAFDDFQTRQFFPQISNMPSMSGFSTPPLQPSNQFGQYSSQDGAYYGQQKAAPMYMSHGQLQ